jgi:hypothetical protein
VSEVHFRTSDTHLILPNHENATAGQFTVNGVSFQPPSVPVLLQILSGTQNASDLLPSGSIYGLEAGKSVELTIPAFAFAGPVRTDLCSVLLLLTFLTTSASYSLAWCKSIIRSDYLFVR